MTPEGKVKAALKKMMLKYRPQLHWYMPVPGGYGAPALDFHGVCNGRAFAVETKAPGKTPTPRQRNTIRELKAAGAMVVVIDGQTGIEELETWIVRTLLLTGE